MVKCLVQVAMHAIDVAVYHFSHYQTFSLKIDFDSINGYFRILNSDLGSFTCNESLICFNELTIA